MDTLRKNFQRGLVVRAEIRAYQHAQSGDPLAELRLRSLARLLHWLEQGLQQTAEVQGWSLPWVA